MSFKRLLEIKRRKSEIETQISAMNNDEVDKAMKEAENLDNEEKELRKKMLEMDNIEKRGVSITMPFQKGEDKKEYGVDSPEYRSAFIKRLCGIDLNDVEQRAMTTNSNSAGAAVPTSTLNKILEKIGKRSILYSLVTVTHLRGIVSIPIEGVTNDVQRKAEGADGDILDDTIKDIKLGAKKYIKLVKLTCELEATAIDALEDYIVGKLGKKLADAFDEDIANGTGTNGAKGILQVITPIESETADTLTYDDMLNLMAALPANAKKSANLIMSTNTLYKRIGKIKDDIKRPIFDITEGKILGRHYEECDSIPDDYIIFGDLEEYIFNWNKDVEITKSKEAAFESGDTVFRGLALVDGNLADLGAVVALKIKTA